MKYYDQKDFSSNFDCFGICFVLSFDGFWIGNVMKFFVLKLNKTKFYLVQAPSLSAAQMECQKTFPNGFEMLYPVEEGIENDFCGYLYAFDWQAFTIKKTFLKKFVAIMLIGSKVKTCSITTFQSLMSVFTIAPSIVAANSLRQRLAIGMISNRGAQRSALASMQRNGRANCASWCLKHGSKICFNLKKFMKPYQFKMNFGRKIVIYILWQLGNLLCKMGKLLRF